MEYVYIIGGAVWTAIWRRWFGGWDGDLPVLKWRPVKVVLNLAFMTAAFHWLGHMNWWWTAYAAIVIQGLYWCLAHGPYFDIGSGYPPDEKMIKRYNKMPFHKLLDWLFAYDDNEKYRSFYDYIGMTIRYGWPTMLLIPVFGWPVLILGFAVAAIYGLSRSIRHGHKWPFGKLTATGFAEIIAGFVSGLVLYRLAI